MRLVIQAIFSWSGDFTGVKIVIRQLHPIGIDLAQQLPVAVQSRVEARFEHSFGLRRRCLESQHLQGPEFGKNTDEEAEKSFAKSGRLIVRSPALLVTRARKIEEKLSFRHARLILHNVGLLQTP